MRDDLAFVEKVQRDLRDVRWPGPEEIRARARRRNWRNVAAAAAALALAGVSAIAVVAPGRSSTPPTASVGPSVPVRAEITTEALLRPTDLGLASADTQLTDSGLAEPIRIDDMLGACRTSQGLSQTWPSRWSRSQTLLTARPDGVDLAPSDVVAMQDVYRLTPGGAETFLADLDQIIAPCVQWRSVGPYEWKGRAGTAEAVHQWRIVRRDFAGDDAAMVQHLVSPARDMKTGETFGDVTPPTYKAIIRVGDLVAVLGLGRHGTESELLQLATVAASRMCQAANPGC
ncbi:hypothetical protein [Micromonospora sp. WMMD812]|uniref:hypothetical protein n=1 Tax=Micromonospora sp. WMMD812 TaxID=3015152 RepID=UPI00248A8F70|nr:hypothetical protein [Micromonospora sp. WMMD812]WBB65001.1 hypothetical protein O7603_17385 [Micromonospora sp. WMMD812]